MQTDRLTILVEPSYKAAIARQAAVRGVSTSEHVRNALDSFERISDSEEAELAILVKEVNAAIPKMRESLDSSIATLAALHDDMDAFLREKGFRT
ncbi:MAG: ribbon-helix-helix protein, CopG family [Sphingomonadaceae bacterium]